MSYTVTVGPTQRTVKVGYSDGAVKTYLLGLVSDGQSWVRSGTSIVGYTPWTAAKTVDAIEAVGNGYLITTGGVLATSATIPAASVSGLAAAAVDAVEAVGNGYLITTAGVLATSATIPVADVSGDAAAAVDAVEAVGNGVIVTTAGVAAAVTGTTNHVLTWNGTTWAGAAGSKVTLTTTGDRLVASGENTLARLPIGPVAIGASEIDFAAVTVHTKTISGATTFTAANDTYGHQSILLVLAVSGAPAAPTWPGTTTVVGSGTWSTTVTNYCWLTRTGTATYVLTYSQAA
jgi:hypothetical protein